MESSDERKPLWEVSVEYILEVYHGKQLEYFRAQLPDSFRKYEEKHGIASRVEIPKRILKSPFDKPKPEPEQEPPIKPLRCRRCGRSWTPRTRKLPVQCPKCKSPYWNREKVKPK